MEITKPTPADSPDYSLVNADSDMLKLRRASSRVWSDLRGAIKAIGKRKGCWCQLKPGEMLIWVAGSQNANTVDYRVEDAQLVSLKRENRYHDSHTTKDRSMTPGELVKRLRLDTFGITPSTTVILRSAPLRNRRRRSSIQALNNMYTQRAEPQTSASNIAIQAPTDTTASRQASMESLTSTSSKEGLKRRNTHRFLRAKSNPETLTTIKESCQDTFAPTIRTTETAASVKISIETYYNELLKHPTGRDHRRGFLERELYYNPQMPVEQKDAIRRGFFHQESCYLRQCRVLKSQSQTRRKTHNNVHACLNFEPVQVLGKGSFGVVRLVREQQATPHVPPQVFAMKVIRKSDMLSSSQEGHLRAERDFLVAAEGSNW